MTSLIVVEDELKTLNGIVNLIKTFGSDFNVLATARSGSDGLGLCLAHNPDIVLADIRMPEMDGLTMVSKLRENGFEGKIIILSAHSDFEYTRKALWFGIYDYILKPITPIDLRTVLEKASAAINNGRGDADEVNRIAIFDRLSLLNFDVEPQDCSSFSCLFDTASDGIAVPLVAFFDTRLTSGESDLALEVFKLSFSALRRHYISVLPGRRQINVIAYCKDFNEFRYALGGLMERLAGAYCPVFAVFDDHPQRGLADRFSGILKLLPWSITFSAYSSVSSSHIDSIKTESMVYPEAIEKSIIGALYTNNPEASRAGIDSFAAFLLRVSYRPQDIYEAMMRLTNTIIYHLKSINQSLYNDLEQTQILGWIERCLTLDTFKNILFNLLNQLTLYSRTNGLRGLSKITSLALNIIHRDFANDVSLESVAGVLDVTPEYLSRRFGSDLNKSFVVYLNEYRIERAKEYLITNKYKIYEVASMTGFSSSKYFASVFLKYTGCNPRDYCNL